MATTFYDLLMEGLEGAKHISQGEILGFCPFPHDTTGRKDSEGGSRSLSANYEKGLWKCFSCGKAGYDAQLVAQIKGIPLKEAKKLLGYIPRATKEVPVEEVRGYHQLLLKNQEVMAWLQTKRGIFREDVMEWQLGYDEKERRLWIPIRDDFDRIVDCRRHAISLYPREGHQKSLAYKTGYGHARLFPAKHVDDSDNIVLCEGELDAILARRLGINAFSVSGTGAGGWDYKLNKCLSGKTVTMLYDTDVAGREGAIKVAAAIHPVAADVRIATMDLPDGMKDVTDFLIKAGRPPEELQLLIQQAPPYVQDRAHTSDGPVTEVHLAESSVASLFGRRIRVRAMVAGKDMAPFIYPKKVTLTCPTNRKLCSVCGLQALNGKADLTITANDDDLLRFINCEDSEQRSEIARRLGIAPCPAWEYKVVEAGNIEEIKLIPDIDFSVKTAEYCMRPGFFVGHGIQPNHVYEFTGISGADPVSQHAVPIFSEASSVRGSLENYEMTPDIHRLLSLFQVDEDEHRED